MHLYRTHTCGALTLEDVGKTVRLSGWVHRKRDHGHLLFLDLRDHYGITQCVADMSSPFFDLIESTKVESVVTIIGNVVKRTEETVNLKLATGTIEIKMADFLVQSLSEQVPFSVNSDEDSSEELRLKYRFLDLRRLKIHQNITLRSKVISSIRNRMIAQGFTEFQTPILTSSSPEGARDFLVPSRLHPGKFYALPQAPQQFKQLLMIAGFDKYFQIAPCFRDEDSRADRSPGEFYQLDFEMSFVTQEDVFQALEPVLYGVFEEFAEGRHINKPPFIKIPYYESLLKYGTDKPDLRNPIYMHDVGDIFRNSKFDIFARALGQGQIIRAIKAPGAASKPRSFFDKLTQWVQEQGLPGLAHLSFLDNNIKGPIAKSLDSQEIETLKSRLQCQDGDVIFFLCHDKDKVEKIGGQIRTRLGEELNLIDKQRFEFCWIVDFPMYEKDPDTGKIEFSHNPFSMPQGGLEALKTKDPLDIKAYQYDIVCNGIELSSGAIRNHLPDIMYKAFSIAGYDKNEVEKRFGGMLNALKFGAPPHGGSAPGIDRIVMLLANEKNIREVVAFPMNQKAEDLLMQAPAEVPEERLKELYIRLNLPPSLKKDI
ncbi:MAG: aspartate--tRNA ligase [Alphaproteobacteria bacterium]|nr:aspartate--tRNA ligase [Alphaproteobacteria bacterium]